MKNRTIRKQINTLSGLSIAFLLIVAAASLVSILMMTTSFVGFNDATKRTERLNLILADLLKANGAATAYEHSADASFAVTVQNEVDGILLESTSNDQVTETSVEFASVLNQITEQAAQYVKQFGALETAQNERATQIKTLGATGGVVSQALADLGTRASTDGQVGAVKQVTTATHDFLLARLSLERYLRTQSRADLSASEDWLTSTQAAFGRAGKLLTGERYEELKTNAQQNLTAFIAAKANVISALDQRGQAASGLVFASGRMSRIVDEAVDTASLQQSDIWEKNRRYAGILAGIQAIVIIAALATLFLSARRISQHVRKQIAQTVADMNDLAAGKLEFKIAGIDLETEVGQMARSLEVFRKNALQARQLQEDLREKEAEDERLRVLQIGKEHAAEIARQDSLDREREAIIRDLSTGLGGVVRAAAKGDFSQRIDRCFDQMELDGIVASVNALVDGVENSIEETARVLESVANGDLTARMRGEFSGLFHELQTAIDETTVNLGDVVHEITQQCDEIGSSSKQMEQQADGLSSRAETQAAALEQTSAAMKELSASVQSSADASRKSSSIARTATERVSEAGQIVGASVSAMTDIKHASEKIKDIVAVMDSIAYQTNLLALNASVEAARAGDAGKGFAVVATEVRALAQRSGDASKDIKGLIDETVSQVERGVDLVEQTGKTLSDVVEGVAAMSTTMDDLTNRAQDQAAGVSEVAGAVHQMDAITQKNAALADESREAARALEAKMKVMQSLVGRFQLDRTPTHSGSIAAE